MYSGNNTVFSDVVYMSLERGVVRRVIGCESFNNSICNGSYVMDEPSRDKILRRNSMLKMNDTSTEKTPSPKRKTSMRLNSGIGKTIKSRRKSARAKAGNSVKRMKWTPIMKEHFEDAVYHFLDQQKKINDSTYEPTPSRILSYMRKQFENIKEKNESDITNMNNLTRLHVGSRLQKFRLKLKKEQTVIQPTQNSTANEQTHMEKKGTEILDKPDQKKTTCPLNVYEETSGEVNLQTQSETCLQESLIRATEKQTEKQAERHTSKKHADFSKLCEMKDVINVVNSYNNEISFETQLPNGPNKSCLEQLPNDICGAVDQTGPTLLPSSLAVPADTCAASDCFLNNRDMLQNNERLNIFPCGIKTNRSLNVLGHGNNNSNMRSVSYINVPDVCPHITHNSDCSGLEENVMASPINICQSGKVVLNKHNPLLCTIQQNKIGNNKTNHSHNRKHSFVPLNSRHDVKNDVKDCQIMGDGRNLICDIDLSTNTNANPIGYRSNRSNPAANSNANTSSAIQSVINDGIMNSNLNNVNKKMVTLNCWNINYPIHWEKKNSYKNIQIFVNNKYLDACRNLCNFLKEHSVVISNNLICIGLVDLMNFVKEEYTVMLTNARAHILLQIGEQLICTAKDMLTKETSDRLN